MTHYSADHLLHRPITLLVSLPYVYLKYFMTSCIGLNSPFLKDPCWLSLAALLPASLFLLCFFFPPLQTCLLSETRCYLNFYDLNLIIQVSFLPKLEACHQEFVWRGRREGNKSFLHKFAGLVWAGISYQLRASTLAVFLRIIYDNWATINSLDVHNKTTYCLY